jgi:hypothetical protein
MVLALVFFSVLTGSGDHSLEQQSLICPDRSDGGERGSREKLKSKPYASRQDAKAQRKAKKHIFSAALRGRKGRESVRELGAVRA